MKSKSLWWLLLLVFFSGIFLCMVRYAMEDEVYYLLDALRISDCLKEGHWFGNETVGFHGFLFKIPAALLFLLTGPSIFAATFTNILLAVASVYLSYLIYHLLLKSPRWALAGSFLTFSSVFFLRALATFLRDTAIVFALLLLIYLVLKAGNKWLIGLALLLVLDAKESVFFMILPGVICWVLYEEYLKQQRRFSLPLFSVLFSRLCAVFLPAFVLLTLMFTSPLVPMNPIAAKILGVHDQGFKLLLSNFLDPQKATANTQENGNRIFQFSLFDNYGWTAFQAGTVTPTAETVGPENNRVVQLSKPEQKSNHVSGGHYHRCRQMEPVQCIKGDTIVYSTWYKSASANANDLYVVNWLHNTEIFAGSRYIKLEKDGFWHHVTIEVPVTQAGLILPEFRWNHARDMVLDVAGCKIEKKNAGEPARSGVNTRFPPTHLSSGHLRNWVGANLVFAHDWWITVEEKIKKVANVILLYVGKLFYPRTFSFTSIPRFIFIPALFMSLCMFGKWRREGQYEKLFLPVVLWWYLLFYWLRPSMGRYLLPVVPVILLFFIFFLLEGLQKKEFARNTLITTTIFALTGLMFESNYPIIKILIILLFLCGWWLLYYFHHKRERECFLSNFKAGFIFALGILSILTFLGTSYAKPYQLGHWLAWGTNNQMKEIAAHFKKQETVWTNIDPALLQFYRHDNVYSAFREKQNLWLLASWVPKAKMLKLPAKRYTSSLIWENSFDFQQKLQKHGVEKIALLISTHKSKTYTFPDQQLLPQLLALPLLRLEKKVELKNKTLYIFHHHAAQELQ